MKTSGANWIGRCCLSAATLLAGGTVLGACEVRFRDALVTSTKFTVLSMFDTALADITEDFTIGDATGN